MRETLLLARLSWLFMAGRFVKWRSAGNCAGEIAVVENQSNPILLPFFQDHPIDPVRF